MPVFSRFVVSGTTRAGLTRAKPGSRNCTMSAFRAATFSSPFIASYFVPPYIPRPYTRIDSPIVVGQLAQTSLQYIHSLRSLLRAEAAAAAVVPPLPSAPSALAPRGLQAPAR
jgi:hypothetical protein